MKKSYKQLNQLDRDRIEALLTAGHKQQEIAKILDRNKATISREIKRNRRKLRIRSSDKDKSANSVYQSSVANHKAYVRRKYSKYQGMKIRENKELESYIKSKLKLHWSPDEISGRMKLESLPFYASKDLIYQWLYSVWGQRHTKYLYSKRWQKRKRKPKTTEKFVIPNRIGIESRPIEVTKRSSFGHLEGDAIVSGKSSTSKASLAVAYERKARYIDARKVNSLRPADFNLGMKRMLDNLNKKETITLDNGFENRDHEKLGIKTYFCKPYSSWQKGGVENANKMIRRYIPKGSDISRLSDRYVRMVIEKINKKPRKSLGYKTPMEVMLENNLLTNQTRQKVALGG